MSPSTVSLPAVYSAFGQDILLVCLIGSWELRTVISIYTFDRLVFVTGTICVFCDLRAEWFVWVNYRLQTYVGEIL